MSRIPTSSPLGRCCLIWLAVSAACTGVLALIADRLPRGFAPDPARWDATPFDDLLATGCAIALAGCACWFWLVTSLVLVEAATGTRPWQAGCPEGVRRAVLALCGVAIVAGTAAQGPALAGTTAGLPPTPPDTDQRALAGLRLPERPSAGMELPRQAPPQATVTPARQVASDRHRIEPGDTLWDLAETRLPPDPSDAEVTRAWQRIWQENRNVIGPDPDLIHPGSVLRLPDQKEH